MRKFYFFGVAKANRVLEPVSKIEAAARAPRKWALSFALFSLTGWAVPDRLTTLAETSQWKKTGRYAEVETLCAAFAESFPESVRCQKFGATAEGRPLWVLIVSEKDLWTGSEAKKAGRPVVFFQGGIHAGEIDGKDAGFQFLRDWIRGGAAKGTLGKVTAVFVPVFNADGHERFGANNRPNQVGPEEMGWRTSAQNLNLNRDYVKAESPEIQSLLKLLNEWDPLLYLDLHVTDGADFQPEMGVVVEPAEVGDGPTKAVARDYREQLIKRLKPHQALPFYPDFRKPNEPKSGVEISPSPPRFSHSYWAMRNRVGVLVETHSWKDYATRTRATYDALVATMEIVAKQGKGWLKRISESDTRAMRLGGSKVPLVWDVTDKNRIFDFPGYEYTQEHSEISGQTWIRYDRTKPVLWKIPLYEDRFAALSALAPKAGYLIPRAHRAWIQAKLDLHGIQSKPLTKAQSDQKVETFSASDINFAKESFEGRNRLSLQGSWNKSVQTLPEGALFVPINQPKSRLVIHLLDPTAPDSLAAWGFFNAHFEKKEYMEDYVAEAVAREMLQRPEVKKEFEERVARDATFAKDPEARLEFFHRLHPSWDNRYGVYPVLKLAQDPTR